MKAIHTITLNTPITRGDQTITTITLIKPTTRSFTGVRLTEVVHLNIDALAEVLPRMTEPRLFKEDITRMDISDTFQLGIGVIDFLLPKPVVLEDCANE